MEAATPATPGPDNPQPQQVLTRHSVLDRITWSLVGLLVIAFTVSWIRLMGKPRGDYDIHWAFARKLLNHQPLYVREMDLFHPYPPFWAVFHVPVAFFPMQASQLVVYPVGVAVMIGVFVLLWRLVRPFVPASREARLAIVTLSALLASRYLLRDLPEVAVNTLLVLLVWLGIRLWMSGRDWLGGTSIAFAAALKCTPALFIVYFAWKRQWRMFVASTTMAVLFTISPIVWMGPALYASEMGYWLRRVIGVARQPDPSIGVLGEDPLINMSLRPRLARYLMQLPEGHNLRPAHGHVDFLNLAPETAGLVVRAVTIGLVVLAAWFYRRRIVTRREPHVLWECAGISLMALLFSPTSWSQHAVAVLPACFLLSAAVIAYRTPWWVKAILGYWVVAVLLLNRGIFGRAGTIVFDSYGLETWAIVALLALTFAGAVRARGGLWDSPRLPESQASGPDHPGSPR
jgi:alpha-1,2-mannosyltransferase